MRSPVSNSGALPPSSAFGRLRRTGVRAVPRPTSPVSNSGATGRPSAFRPSVFRPFPFPPFPFPLSSRIGAALLVTFILALMFASPKAMSQAEHVEVGHPVYPFLNRLQLRGVLPDYSRAMLPLERKQVTDFVRRLAERGTELSAAERELAARFADEFVAEADGRQDAVVLFQTPVGEVLPRSFSDREKFLYRWRSEDGESFFAAEFLGSLEYRARTDGDVASNVTLAQLGGRFRGTMGGTVGYGLRATNGAAVGSRALALSDHELRRNFNFADLDKDFFDFSEAYVTATWNWGSAALGREKRIIGSGISNQVLLGTNAQPFDAVQLTAHAGVFRFLFLHGSLLSQMEMREQGRPHYDSKYVAIHRAEADIAGTVRFGVYESVVYSQREMDFGYLLPVNFYKSAEHAGGDRDNPMLGFDLATLFIPGTQLYGSWLIDDVDFSLLGEDSWGNKFIWQGGAMNASLLPNTDLTLEYTRIEPYVYSHRLDGNQYSHDGDALGVELPPNSDELYASLRHWIGASLWLQLEWHHRRHGRNEVDAEGNIVVNNGADIFASRDYDRDSAFAPFLAGPRDNSDILTFSLHWEPWRNIFFRGLYRFRDLRSELDGSRTDHFGSLGVWVEY
ncbi:MAG: hypothetical protein KFF77_02670 [Bacteroidetes bacterium]|nr:hypothetical protein [Bacteroidota bacterium]